MIDNALCNINYNKYMSTTYQVDNETEPLQGELQVPSGSTFCRCNRQIIGYCRGLFVADREANLQ